MYDETSAALRSEQLKKEMETALYAKERESKKAMDLANQLTENLSKTSTTNKSGRNRSVVIVVVFF